MAACAHTTWTTSIQFGLTSADLQLQMQSLHMQLYNNPLMHTSTSQHLQRHQVQVDITAADRYHMCLTNSAAYGSARHADPVNTTGAITVDAPDNVNCKARLLAHAACNLRFQTMHQHAGDNFTVVGARSGASGDFSACTHCVPLQGLVMLQLYKQLGTQPERQHQHSAPLLQQNPCITAATMLQTCRVKLDL